VDPLGFETIPLGSREPPVPWSPLAGPRDPVPLAPMPRLLPYVSERPPLVEPPRFSLPGGSCPDSPYGAIFAGPGTEPESVLGMVRVGGLEMVVASRWGETYYMYEGKRVENIYYIQDFWHDYDEAVRTGEGPPWPARMAMGVWRVFLPPQDPTTVVVFTDGREIRYLGGGPSSADMLGQAAAIYGTYSSVKRLCGPKGPAPSEPPIYDLMPEGYRPPTPAQPLGPPTVQPPVGGEVYPLAPEATPPVSPPGQPPTFPRFRGPYGPPEPRWWPPSGGRG